MLEFAFYILFTLGYECPSLFLGSPHYLDVWVVLGFIVINRNYVILSTPPNARAFRRYNELIPTHGFLLLVTFILCLNLFADLNMSSLSARALRSAARYDSARNKGTWNCPEVHALNYCRHTSCSAAQCGADLLSFNVVHENSQTLTGDQSWSKPRSLAVTHPRHSLIVALDRTQHLNIFYLCINADRATDRRGVSLRARQTGGDRRSWALPARGGPELLCHPPQPVGGRGGPCRRGICQCQWPPAGPSPKGGFS